MADNIVIGTQVYWSSMTSYLKTFIDCFTDALYTSLASKRVYLLMEGTAPDDGYSLYYDCNTTYLLPFPHELYEISC